MPYPSEHSARLQDPGKYVRFRRENDKFGPGIHAIWGVTKAGKVELQAIRFDAEKFTAAEAKAWLKEHDHKPIRFEPASEKSEGAAGLDLLSEPGSLTIEAAGEAADGKPRLPRFSMVAYTGAAMQLGAWAMPVVVDLEGLSIPSQTRPVRFGHDPMQGVGHTESIRIEAGRIVASGLISRDTPAAREIVAAARNGFPWQASIGASVQEFEILRKGESGRANGRDWEGPVNVVRRAVLGEISFVDLGADLATTATVAATRKETGMPKEKENVEPKADVKTDSTPDIKAAQPPPPDTPPAGRQATDPVADIRAAALAETKRLQAIRTACAGKHPDIEATAIEQGWDGTKTELEVMRADRPKAPAVHVPDQAVTAQILEAACLLSGRAEGVEKACDPKVLEAAQRRFRRSIGLQELLLEAAWANGYEGRNFRESREVLRAAFGRHRVEAALSTMDVGGILSNVANKFLLEGFFSVEKTWRNVCAVRNVRDFKTVTSYRLVGIDQYERVAPGGELRHGTLGEEPFTNKADTYGLMLGIDRRDIINDDLGALTTVPRKLGRGSGLKINDVFWTVFLNNSAFFATNLVTSADLGIDGLTKAETAFNLIVDADGKPTGIAPAILLVPVALSAMASQLYKALEIRDTNASTKYPVANPHAGKFRVEVGRYMSNSAYTGWSATSWYLLADPADLPVIEVVFLNGQESPTIETADADFNVLGIRMRGYHDFGVALQDEKGGMKATA